MSKVLVSEAVFSSLAEAQQQIDYDPVAMEEMASALNAPFPGDEDPIYVFYKKDIRMTTMPGSLEKPISTPVHRQGPYRRTSYVVPDRKIFAVTLEDPQFDTPDLSAATANRLALPRRHRREVAAGIFGGALVLGSIGLALGEVVPWPAVIPANVAGYALMAWGGPKQRIPDTSKMSPPLFLRAAA